MSELMDTFEGFRAEDFDAYLPEKWNSNVYTLPRRSVKTKLEELGAQLSRELETAQLALVMHLSDEFPSLWNKKKVDTQWLFFSRDEAARAELSDIIDTERTLAATLTDPTPRYRHIFLGVAVDKDVLEIGLRLPYDAWVDRQNFIKLLNDEQAQQRFCEHLNQLPEHYETGLAGEAMTSPSHFGTGEVGSLIEQFEQTRGWLFIGARMPRDQAEVLGTSVVETACEAFKLLVPVYRFMAWSPENDAISFDKLVAQRHEALAASKAELDRERAEREAQRVEQEQQRLLLKDEIEERVRENQAWLKRETAIQRAQAAKAAAQAKQESARAKAEALASQWGLGEKKSEPAADKERDIVREEIPPQRDTRSEPAAVSRSHGGEPRTDKRAESRPPEPSQGGAGDGAIRIGNRVKVLRGFLAGRRGVVQEIDDKGGVRVGFGSLISRLTVDEIETWNEAPGQRSDHRKSPRRRTRG